MIPTSTFLRRWLTWPTALLLLSLSLSQQAMAEQPPAPKLLPASTIAMVSIVDVQEVAERFMNTSMGRMSQDPQMKPLIGQVYRSVAQAMAQAEVQIGLSLSELLAIPQGEATFAVVPPEQGPPAIVALIDVGDQTANARKLLKRVAEERGKSGATRTEETVAGAKVVTYQGDGRIGPRTLILFEKDATIGLATDIGVLKQILSAWNGGQGDTLADNPSFGAIMQRCGGAKGEPPHIVLYADPIGIVRAMGQGNTQAQIGLAILPALGLDGLSAVGGSMIFDTEQFDSVMHAHVLLESPRSGVIEMIALESGDVTPEPWVPADVAGYTTLHWDIEKTYTKLSGLYDSFYEEGAFSRMLERRILGPTGIDIGKDIIPSLGGRITLINWFSRPVTIRSQAMLAGLSLKEAEPVRKAVQKVVDVSQGRLVKKTHAGKTYYKLETANLADLPPERRPPAPCFGVLGDTLLISNNATLLEKAITTSTGGIDSLAGELDFKLIASRIRRNSGGAKPAVITFERPEESMRFVYDLINSEQIRTGLATQAENNPFFKSLDTALKQNTLPPFEVLQRYLAPSGGMVIDDATGIHYTAFSLRRKSN